MKDQDPYVKETGDDFWTAIFKQLKGEKPVPKVTSFYNRNLPPPTEKPQITPSPVPTQIPQGVIPGFTTWKPPQDQTQMVLEAAKKYNVHPAILAGVIQTESGFNPDVKDNVSKMQSGQVSRDRGEAQISDIFHPEVNDQQARDPKFAIEYAAKLLADNQAKRNDWRQAIASYNVGNRVGPSPSRDAQGLGPKGRDYLNAVIKNIDPETLKQLGI